MNREEKSRLPLRPRVPTIYDFTHCTANIIVDRYLNKPGMLP